MIVELDVKSRLVLPRAKNHGLQNLWFFNLYRSASSLTEAIAATIADFSSRTHYAVMNELASMGVSIIDPQDTAGSHAFLDPDAQCLTKLCNFGGYVFHGFREVPPVFAKNFTHVGASILAVRDPRDIGISQYYAVRKHVVLDNSLGEQMKRLKSKSESISLEEFILSEETIRFLTRICMCYSPLVKKGVPVIRYEDSSKDGETFDQRNFVTKFWYRFEKYIDEGVTFSRFYEGLEDRISKSNSLKGHATTGRINTYRDLDPSVLKAYNKALREPLATLGYN